MFLQGGRIFVPILKRLAAFENHWKMIYNLFETIIHSYAKLIETKKQNLPEAILWGLEAKIVFGAEQVSNIQ